MGRIFDGISDSPYVFWGVIGTRLNGKDTNGLMGRNWIRMDDVWVWGAVLCIEPRRVLAEIPNLARNSE